MKNCKMRFINVKMLISLLRIVIYALFSFQMT